MNELIIDFSSKGEKIALLRDKKLVELHQQEAESSFSVGDLYLGKVKKFKPEIRAAFVDVGYHKDAFLHYHDLGPHIRSVVKLSRLASQGGTKSVNFSTFKKEKETLKTGKITDVLKKNQQILVQVVKEPISSKGPRLSAEISIAGKYYIFVPFISNVSVSKKITSEEERNRLKNLSVSLKGENYGLICRTAAEGKAVKELHQDIQNLETRWNEVLDNLKNARPGQLVYGDSSRSHMVLRDLLSQKFETIVTNDKGFHDELKLFLNELSPEMSKALKLYKGKTSLFSHYGIDKQIKMSFGKTVNLKGGPYLVIEHTEALHVIDVNSGNTQMKGEKQEDYALQVNIDAAEEIARQLRLRDMGGIIVIDFIDLRTPAKKRQLTDALKKAMEDDLAKHTILPVTKFGLVQITRQRVRPELKITTSEDCPMCGGTGKVDSSMLLSDEVENKLIEILKFTNHKAIELVTNPYLGAYFKQGFMNKPMKWYLKYKKWVKVTIDPNYHYGAYKIL
jgi:ribonuclease G